MATDAKQAFPQEVIPIVGRQDFENLGIIQLNILERKEVPVSEISRQMQRILGGLQQVLKDLPGALGAFQLTEMEVSLEISAKGHVSLLGTGGEAGGKGGITLKLKKN